MGSNKIGELGGYKRLEKQQQLEIDTDILEEAYRRRLIKKETIWHRKNVWKIKEKRYQKNIMNNPIQYNNYVCMCFRHFTFLICM